MKKYCVEVTDVEDKALSDIAYSVQDWLDNFVKNRARKAINQIYERELDRLSKDPNIKHISLDKNEVVMNWPGPNSKEREDELQQQRKKH